MLEKYFSRFWFGVPFEIFNTPHVVSLLIICMACLAVAAFKRRFNHRVKRKFRLALTTTLLLTQASFVLWLFYIEEASLATALPLHLCSLFNILSALMLVTNSYNIYKFSYFLGTGGAIFALITPDIGMFNFPHFLPMQTMVAHGSLLLAQVYMTAVEGYRPTLRSLLHVYAGVLFYTAAIIVINTITGANYLFFSHKPDFPTPLDYLGPWPWYVVNALILGAIACALLYLPFIPWRSVMHREVAKD